MSDNLATGVVSIALGVLGVATLAVIFSTKSNAAGVIQAGGSALANNIAVAVSPITGGNVTPNVSYPSTSAL
jgi:PRD1 phage membrane DNA delivery